MSTARLERQQVSLGAILSLDHAASLLPWSTDEARVWLRQQGLVREVAGRELVRWSDVWEAIGGTVERVAEPTPKAVVLGLRRTRL